ncbi:transketolase C-terminal domain-containing protein [Clostridium sp.]|uniref:transketolase family protein n=1 Tax=Clostridium sp. TaxID=1506 RepID=UPI002590ACBD|nr:transketolase C-terminal domain-containing protein [Clostridium sp.]MDF2504723.1 transketolase, alpha subunit [Clostridium sp.]
MYENVEVRQVFADTLDKIMQQDNRIVVLDADLAKANGTLSLREKYYERAFDIGIAEQNMTSVAAGMAAYGMIPFIGSFTPFASRRICDQIAISICYAKRNVKIVGTDPGIAAELNGGTHMSFEDIGVLRSIPNIVIYEVVDAVQLEKALPKIINYEGPVYIRMFRKAAPVIFDENYEFDLFKVDLIKEGTDVSIFATGIMVKEAIEAEKILRQENINAEVINMHTIKPIDRDAVIKSAQKTGAVVTCENHNIIGGLRSAVAEVLIEENPVPVEAVGIKDHFGEVGFTPYLMDKYGMTKEHIVEAVKEVINKKQTCLI